MILVYALAAIVAVILMINAIKNMAIKKDVLAMKVVADIAFVELKKQLALNFDGGLLALLIINIILMRWVKPCMIIFAVAFGVTVFIQLIVYAAEIKYYEMLKTVSTKYKKNQCFDSRTAKIDFKETFEDRPEYIKYFL